MKRSLAVRAVLLCTAAMAYLAPAPARGDLDAGDVVKYIQLPDLSPNGLDVLATRQPILPIYGTSHVPKWKILADDFPCTQTGLITDIHIWGSWLNNQLPRNPSSGASDPGLVTFKLSLHADIPATPTSHSRPGDELWSHVFTPGTFRVAPPIGAQERFYDPNIDAIIGDDNEVYLYNFEEIPNPFTQNFGNIYWLDVQAVTEDPEATFGWKTSQQHFNDDAVYADTDGFNRALLTEWTELRYPDGPFQGQSIDMAFAITTVPEISGLFLVGGSLGLAVSAVKIRARLARSAAGR